MGDRTSLSGRTVVVTRERPGELGRLLTDAGATVVHVPTIEVVDVPGVDDVLAAAADELRAGDWLVVTSAAGAERVGDLARRRPDLRLAAVGTATADVLARRAGRSVDVVPTVQRAAALANAVVAASEPGCTVLAALADRADLSWTDVVRASGRSVVTVTAYRTVDVRPGQVVPPADATVFVSSSAVESWVAAFGPWAPGIVVVIGPGTAATARELSLKVAGVAADQSLAGVVDELTARLVAADPPT